MKIHHIWGKFPAEDVNRILDQWECELDLEFAGFTAEYAALAAIIPRHFTILDCGCYLAAQCWYFRKHKAYLDWIGRSLNALQCQRNALRMRCRGMA